MNFVSFLFIAYLLAIVPLYFLCPGGRRAGFLLAVSLYLFFCWNGWQTLLLLASIAVGYACALGIDRASSGGRKAWLLAGLAGNLGLLFAFKYFDFFASAWNALACGHLSLLGLALPVGISFYTFQSMGYLIDVYRGQIRARERFREFALFISFFPQLVAGPIERASRLTPQFSGAAGFDYDRVVSGIRWMLWGYFQKCVVADRLAPFVEAVYKDPAGSSGPGVLLATYAFAFQIYCDFAGYSNIAIGCARILGIDLMLNFNSPYASRTIPEFWRRWHISLSTWFRDYLYFPLGGSRQGPSRTLLNLAVVFALSGLWHGANWTFAVWGALHFAYMAAYFLAGRFHDRQTPGADPGWRLRDRLGCLLTFHLVCFAWIFFRAPSIRDSWQLVLGLSRGWEDLPGTLQAVWKLLRGSGVTVPYLALLGGFLGARRAWRGRGNDPPPLADPLAGMAWPGRWAVYVAFLLVMFRYGSLGRDIHFIYFRF